MCPQVSTFIIITPYYLKKSSPCLNYIIAYMFLVLVIAGAVFG